MTIKQGDSYSLPIMIKLNKQPIDDEVLESLSKVEFCLGQLPAKYWTPAENSEVEFKDGKFLYPISQEESFSFSPSKDDGRITMDIRIRFINADVRGTTTKVSIKVADATSDEVL